MSDISSISASTDPGESSNASEDESFDDDVGCDPEDIVEDGELEGENGDDDDGDDGDFQGFNLYVGLNTNFVQTILVRKPLSISFGPLSQRLCDHK